MDSIAIKNGGTASVPALGAQSAFTKLLILCLLFFASSGVRAEDQPEPVEEYRSIVTMNTFAERSKDSLPDGWRVYSGDNWRHAEEAAPESWSLDESGVFHIHSTQPMSLVSPVLSLDPDLIALSGSVMAEGVGSAQVALAWIDAAGETDDVMFHESPGSADDNRRFNLSESLRPKDATALRIVLVCAADDEKGFGWKSLRLSGLFHYVPEIKLFYNRVGYEEEGPKRFTVWSNFQATETKFVLKDMIDTVVFQSSLGDATRIVGIDGSAWTGFYYQGNFSDYEEEGSYRLEISIDDFDVLEAPIEIGFNLLWEKAFYPVVAAFQRHRPEKAAAEEDGPPQLWHDPGLNSMSDAEMLWALVYSWSILCVPFAGSPAVILLEEEARYGTRSIAQWVAADHEKALQEHPQYLYYLNALSCMSKYLDADTTIVNVARQLLDNAIEDGKDGAWLFYALLDFYVATEEEAYLDYAAAIDPGPVLDRIEPLLEYESQGMAAVTIALTGTFNDRMEKIMAASNNPFGLIESQEKDGRGYFLWKTGAEDPCLGNNTRILEVMESIFHAFRYTARKDYLRLGFDQLNWILGNNPYGLCLVTGLCDENPPLWIDGEGTDNPPPGLVLHGIGPKSADKDIPYIAVDLSEKPQENTNGYSLANNARYLRALASLKRIPVVRSRK
ncbi:MAG: cellulase N-terminal Ig-like domain-containing protein [Candidatus Hydrogenedentales bacterium]|jgi:hypothetical protein